MRKISIILLILSVGYYSSAQSVGIGTLVPDNSALLDLKSGGKGLLIPRTNAAGRNSILLPAKGLMVYDTTDNFFWFYNGSSWNTVGSSFQLPYTASININSGNGAFSIVNSGLATPIYSENLTSNGLGIQTYGGLRGIDATAWNGTGSRSSIGVFGTYYFGVPIAPSVGGVGVMGLGRGSALPALGFNNKHFGMYAEAQDYGIYAKSPLVTGIAGMFQGQTWMQGSQHYSHFNFGVNEDTYIRAGKDNAMVIIGDGTGQRVGIGSSTVATGFTLSVSGKVITEEVQIQLKSAWPDYVFNKGYSLLSIYELEKHINKYQHLPNIPSALEIEKNGLIVGDTHTRMLEKIEELTLYIIQLKKECDFLKSRLDLIEIIKQ